MSPAQEATTKDKSKAQGTNEPKEPYVNSIVNSAKGYQLTSQAKEIRSLESFLICITIVNVHI